MYIFMFLATTVLSFLLTPGILLSLPPKGGRTTVAMVHALVFAAVWTLSHKMLWKFGVNSGAISTHGGGWAGKWGDGSLEGMTMRQCKEQGKKYDAGSCV